MDDNPPIPSSEVPSSEAWHLLLRDEKLKSLHRLAYGASHEINNPLANIASRAQLLLGSESDPQRRHELATIYTQAMRGHEMIADLMLFARPPRPKFAPCDLAEILRTCHAERLPAAERQATDLTLTLPAGPIPLVADDNQLLVALGAAVRNGLEALVTGGELNLAAESHEDRVVVTITDTGPGISEEMAQAAFDPFHSGREAGRGLGFGLSKCWTIVTAHHGSVSFDTSHAGGAKLVIWIPCSPPASPEAPR